MCLGASQGYRGNIDGKDKCESRKGGVSSIE